MLTINVPESLSTYSQISQQDISFIHYREATPAGRNLISFTQCAISFILSGQKEFFRGDSVSVVMRQGQGIVIPQGNAIIAERELDTAGYSSLVIFFPLNIAIEFLRLSTPIIPNSSSPYTESRDFLPFELTPYLNSYVTNLLDLISQKAKLSYPVMRHKLQELFLLIAEMHPKVFNSLWNSTRSNSELHLRNLIESNISKRLTLEELAFLANRSLASFKRDFQKAYGTSPGNYLLKRKMEIAGQLLRSGKRPLEVADSVGYETLSNFTAAFKKFTGQTPREYQSAGVLIEPFAI